MHCINSVKPSPQLLHMLHSLLPDTDAYVLPSLQLYSSSAPRAAMGAASGFAWRWRCRCLGIR